MFKQDFKNIFNNFQKGNILLFAMVFGFISFSLIVVGVSSYSISEYKASVYKQNSELAFQIAESGINYYKWHLAHDGNDFQDGTGEPGPYVHDYKDKNDNLIGYFSLNITPPSVTSSIVTIESTGWTIAEPDSKRTIRVKLGYESLTDYSIATNAIIWMGDTEFVNGKLHSNNGIRFDGTSTGLVSSAVETYNCPPSIGCSNETKPGVWGTGGPQEYWRFPVPAEDFGVVTAKLAEIKNYAQNGGLYLSSSGKQGWRLQFLADGTINVYKVKSTDCYIGADIGSYWWEWFCIDIKKLDNVTNYPAPGNGYIYVDDNLWVDGVVSNYMTIGIGENSDIIINNNITYKEKNGDYVLGLISQENVLIPHNSPNDLEINAALLAQNGGVKRYYFPGNIKNNLITYGSIISHNEWTFSWVDGGGSTVSGYQNTSMNYDPNLLYNAPPGFPTGSEYKLFNWEEVR